MGIVKGIGAWCRGGGEGQGEGGRAKERGAWHRGPSTNLPVLDQDCIVTFWSVAVGCCAIADRHPAPTSVVCSTASTRTWSVSSATGHES